MKIALLESLNVSETLIQNLAQPFIDQGHEFVYYSEKTTDEAELYQRAKDAEIVMIANNPLPNSVINQLDNLQLINIAFTGTDHVDSDFCEEKGIQIMNASGYAVTAVSELAIGLAISLYRNIPQGNQDIREGSAFPGKIPGLELNNKIVGIVGTGEIGLRTAQLFKSFGCHLIGYNRSEKETAKQLGLVYHSLEEVMALSDIISLHLPLTDETRGIISQEMLDLMKPDAVIMNLARGPVMDNHALVKSLQNEQIAGAALDVFDIEPPLADQSIILQTPHIVLTPHIGYLTNEAMEERAKIVFHNIAEFLQCKTS